MEPSLVSEITEDREYMECVKDILCHPVFQSMDSTYSTGLPHVRPTVYRFHTLDISCANSWEETGEALLGQGFSMICFYTIGIPMLRRRASTFMDSPTSSLEHAEPVFPADSGGTG